MTDIDHERFSDLFTRLEKATGALESIVKRNSSTGVEKPVVHELNGSTASVVIEEEDTPSIKAFHEFLELYVDGFASLSQEINPLVGQQAESLARAFKEQLKYIKAASLSQKPDFTNESTAALLAPLQTAIAEINDFKDSNRKSEYFPHLSAIAEGTGVLSWFLTDTPVSFIPEFKDSATFWTNKVLKEFKEKDPKAAEWVKQYLGMFDGLKLYVKQYHTTGLTYSAQGGDFASALKAQEGSSTSSAGSSSSAGSAAPVPAPEQIVLPAAAAAAAAAVGPAPPPPPPPPPPAEIYAPASTEAPAGGINAVFSELNQGENITKGLKKVDKSQMTHKNPELRDSSLVRVPSAGKKSPPVPKKPTNLSLKPKPEPVIELQGSKWIVKNVEEKHDIVIEGEMSQSVFIGDCREVTVQIKGKVNAVFLSSTLKCAIVVDSSISGVDIVNSKKFGVQVVVQVPQISVDKSDEGQIYLSKTSLDTEVYTSSTTSLNINVPDGDDFKELNVPEQFKHTFSNGKMSSTIVEHAG